MGRRIQCWRRVEGGARLHQVRRYSSSRGSTSYWTARAETLFGSFIKGGVKSHRITVQGADQKGDLGYAYGRWEADAGGKKFGGHWTNVLMNEGGQWRTALHTWTLEQ